MISKLHYISQELGGKSHEMLIEEACEAGVKWVQLRIKNKSEREILLIAQNVRAICDRFNVTFILNDYVLIAKAVGADGVHLGKMDMKPKEARALLGEDLILGGTANTIDDVKALHLADISYIGLGPFQYTTTKEKLSPVLGIEGYKKTTSYCELNNIKTPLIAIGGITQTDIQEIISTGIYGIAIGSLINKSEHKENEVKLILSAIKNLSNEVIN